MSDNDGSEEPDHQYEVVKNALDVEYYLSAHSDLRAAKSDRPDFDLVLHYMESGWREGRDPHPDFSTSFYVHSNPDVASSGENPFFHYLTSGKAEGRLARPPQTAAPSSSTKEPDPTVLIRQKLASAFDVAFYLTHNPDVAKLVAEQASFDPVLHYMESGWREGRDPHPDFSTSFYVHSNPDVASSGENPFFHYLTSGKAEGRLARPPQTAAPSSSTKEPDPTVLIRQKLASAFDVAFYLTHNPDVAKLVAEQASFDPVLHYMESGWREGRDPHPDFSTSFYVHSNPDVASSGENPFFHYLTSGKAEGRLARPPQTAAPSSSTKEPDPTVLIRQKLASAFDVAFYLTQNPDVAKLVAEQASFDPVLHYMESGWREGRDPHPDFSTSFYVHSNPDVASSGENPFFHYLTSGKAEGRLARPPQTAAPSSSTKEPDPTVLIRQKLASAFDVAFYLTQNPDVAKLVAEQASFDPVLHYMESGWGEGRDPHPDFSTSFYLRNNPDVASSAQNPFLHYLTRGKAEGRAGSPPAAPPSAHVDEAPKDSLDSALRQIAAEFDEAFYITKNPDLTSVSSGSALDPLRHYVEHGWREGRDPNSDFSTSYYLASNPDVVAAGSNPFQHYIMAGRAEGRLAKAPGGARARYLRSLRPLLEQADAWRVSSKPRALRSESFLFDAIFREMGESGRLVVSIGHDDYTRVSGGIQFCLRTEAQALASEGFCYLNLHPAQPLPILARPSDKIRLNVTCNGKSVGVTRGEDLIAAVRRLSGAASSVTFVVHALHGHAPEYLAELARAAPDAEHYFWVHDYMSLCSGYTLMRNGVSYCGAPAPTSSACEICVYGEERLEQLERLGRMFRDIPYNLIFPSRAAMTIWEASSHLPVKSKTVHPHCSLRRVQSAGTPNRTGRVRVGYLGHPIFHKGWTTFQGLLDRYATAFDFYYLGEVDSGDPRVTWRKVSSSDGGVDLVENPMTAAVAGAELDFVVIWPTWPETFCFVAYEAIAGGARIITNRDSGNVADLVEMEHVGIVLENEAELYEHFARLSRPEAAQRVQLDFSAVTADLITASHELGGR